MAMRKVLLPLVESVLQFAVSVPVFGSLINLSLSYCASLWRLNAGNVKAVNLTLCSRPVKPLILYEFEGCPFCRRAREALSTLRLPVRIYPCPRTTLAAYGQTSNSRFREIATKVSGKCMFPILVDPNYSPSPQVIQDSAVIVDYLWLTYGDKAKRPWNVALLQKARPPVLFMVMPSLCRILPRMGIMKSYDSVIPGLGKQATGEMVTEETPLLQLFGYESCPQTRLVRELLGSAEIPYLMCYPMDLPSPLTVVKAGKTKSESVSLTISRIPTLYDPFADTTINKSYDSIMDHIHSHYILSSAGNNKGVWGSYSTKGASAEHGVMGGRTVISKDS
jgi:glutaredoxin